MYIKKILTLTCLLVLTQFALTAFPVFQYDRLIINPPVLSYNPTGEVIFPSIIKASAYVSNPLGAYYLYYSPHNAPGGICLAYSNNIEGPYTEYSGNPVISNNEEGYYSVTHVASPHVIWAEDYNKFLLYFHGENTTTRWAYSSDGVNWNIPINNVAITASDFGSYTECSYARVFKYTIPRFGDKYTMLLMLHPGGDTGRRIALATSADGKTFTPRDSALVSPQADHAGNLAGPFYFPFENRHYVIFHASSGNIYSAEVGENFDRENHLGIFYNPNPGAPEEDKAADGFPIIADGKWYMFYTAGPRLSQMITLARGSVITSTPTPLPTAPNIGGTDWSVRMCDSLLARYAPGSYGSWNYYNALTLEGMWRVWERTGKAEYFNFIKAWADRYADANGLAGITLNNLDAMYPGIICCRLYQATGDNRYRLAATQIRNNLNTYPRTSDGGLIHNTWSPGELWHDGVFMLDAFLIKYGQVFGDSTYANNECAHQLIIYNSHLYDAATRLGQHGWDEDGSAGWADPVTHKSPEIWCRALGWYVTACMEVLDVLPASHPQRNLLISTVQNRLQGLKAYQDPVSGLWFEVVNKGYDAANWVEESSACMYVYAMSKAVDKGYVSSADYGETIKKGLGGILSNIEINNSGLTDLYGTVQGTGISDFAYYVAQKQIINDSHGLGAFLICYEQVRNRYSEMYVTYQAERAGISNGVVESAHRGYTGAGYVNFTNQVGSYVEFSVNCPRAGTYTLRFRYANGTATNRYCDVSVNGGMAADNLSFNGTGAWTLWGLQTCNVYLNTGNNTIRITADQAEGGPNLDWIGYIASSTQPTVTRTPTPTPTRTPAPTNTPPATSTPTQTVSANTSDITNPRGAITAQYYDSPAGEEIDKLIDNSSSTKYLTFHASGWVQFQANASYVVTSYTITSANDAAERDPYAWTLQGSNNGSTWTTLDSRSGEHFPNRFQLRIFSFANTSSFNYYRLNMSNNSGTILQLAEWELFGTGTGNTASPTPAPTSQPGNVNLAIGKSAVSSSNENASFPANYAVDGNPGTRWSSAFSDPQWIYIDLGASYPVGRVTLAWEAAYGQAYEIQVSGNASSWTTVYSTTSGDGGTDNISFTTASARYVRMYGTARGTEWGYSLWEFEIYQ
ncbi:MAG: glycoside hydrolase family 88 protein [Spirochaetales bacterium]|nr:glycoside hydrolase family 88 protein [Spirochaetales bacterium]